MRYAALVSEKLPLHPSAKDAEYRQGLKSAQKNLPTIIETLEVLKPRINDRYSSWERSLEKRRVVSASVESRRLQPESSHDLASSDPAVAGNNTTIGAAENSQLAVELAHREFRRRDAARRATRQVGVSEREEQERRTAGLWDNWESALSKDGPSQDDEMQKNMEDSRRRTDGSHDIVPDGARRRLLEGGPVQTQTSHGTEYRYPPIQRSQPSSIHFNNEGKLRPQPDSRRPPHVPPKPPKSDLGLEAPLRPAKTKADLMIPDATTPPPTQSFTFRPSAYLEDGKPLRTVFLPPTLRNEFLAHAESNTSRNLETCGMLCGTLISNALFIRRVVIPEQHSTSDTCETTNEGAFFDYCDKEDLLVLGWIHTHPSQTCFMSSRDLHTHAGYQVMMPESIAIVCAPSKNPS